MTRVVNKRVEHGTFYIGRAAGDQHFGNPFSHQRGTSAMVRVKDRAEAVVRHGTWLAGTSNADVEPERRAWILANLYRLAGHTLECFCAPLACHGDNYVEVLRTMGLTRWASPSTAKTNPTGAATA